MATNPRTDDNDPSALESAPAKILRIDLNLWDHKIPLFIQIFIVTIASGILPLAGYIILHYTTDLKAQTILSIFSSVFGVVSLLGLTVRTIRLIKPSSSYRPLGVKSAWALDYYGWNFIVGFIALSVIISVGIAQNPSNVRIVSLSLPLLLLQVCGQMLLFIPFCHAGAGVPFRISSLARGEKFRPACYTIAEDVVAVDGKQSDVFREVWYAKYEASAPFRQLLLRMDYLWGVTGVAVGAGCIAVTFAVKESTVGWAVCWSVPFLWAAVMAVISIEMKKAMCRTENRLPTQ